MQQQTSAPKQELLNHPPRPIALPGDTKKAAKAMLNIIGDVKDVYARETEALKTYDIQAFQAIQEEKMMTVLRYQSGVQQMQERREEIRANAPEFRMQLEEEHANFTVMLQRNMDAIKRAKSTMARMTDRLRSAAQDAVKKDYATSYGETGSVNDPTKKKPLSTGISETA